MTLDTEPTTRGPCRAFMLGDLEVDPVPLHVATPAGDAGPQEQEQLEALRSAWPRPTRPRHPATSSPSSGAYAAMRECQ